MKHARPQPAQAPLLSSCSAAPAGWASPPLAAARPACEPAPIVHRCTVESVDLLERNLTPQGLSLIHI